MKEINIGQATQLTSPNPLVMICTQKEDDSTNLAPVSFVTYLSFNPAMLGFAMGKNAFSGKMIQKFKNVVIAVPAMSLKNAVISCGTTSGSDTDKVQKFDIELKELPDCSIKIPEDTKLAFVAKLSQTLDVGDHYFYICDIEKIYGDEKKEAVFAWNGYSKIAPAKEV